MFRRMFLMLAAAAAALTGAGRAEAAGEGLGCFRGEWVAVRSFNQDPPAVLTFDGDGLVALYGSGHRTPRATCRMTERQDDEGVRIVCEYTHRVTRGNGRVVDMREVREYLWHEEERDGRPLVLLSEMDFEFDGRGEIVMMEYVRRGDLEGLGEDFASELKSRLNGASAPSMATESPAAGSSMTREAE